MDNFSTTGHVIVNSDKPDSSGTVGDGEITTFQEAVLNKVSEGLCVCHDIEAYPYVRFTVWNEKMTEITGYTRDEINRLGWYQAMYPDPEVRNKAITRMDAMRIGDDLISEEWTITTADESKKIVEITTSVLHSDRGHTHVFAMIEDVTEKRADERRKAKLREQMARAEKMESLGLLAGGVAHDLNNILGPVIGYADLLLMDLQGDEKRAAKVQRIKKSATEAADIVNDLLTLARRGRCELLPVKLQTILQECLAAPWFHHLRETNPDIRFETAFHDSDVNILASSSHMKKALMNLIRNAVDAMPTGGTLTIATCRADTTALPYHGENNHEGDYAGITIRDTGHGIESDMLQKIFEPYFSGKSLGSSSGSGLGLAVVYGVVKDHNGVYDVKSAVGKGTEFTLFIPICSETDNEEHECSRDFAGDETILVVDDDERQREMASDMLESLGYDVLTAANGHEAVDVIAGRSVDLVLLDMIMEHGYDGLDTFIAMKKLKPSQKAILVTGYSETDRVKTACDLGVATCIHKPYALDTIGKALRTVLD